MTLSVEQVTELNRKLSAMRHEIYNQLTVVMGAAQIMHSRPDMAEKMIATMTERPMQIKTELDKFSREFEQLMGITRGSPPV